MKITVLVENNTRIDNYLLAEPALSLLIELEGRKILFDTGYSDVFLKNARTLGIDLTDITDIVLSHGHDDHTGGLRYIKPNKAVKLTAHPAIFDEKVDPYGIAYGCPVSNEYLENKFNLNLTNGIYNLTSELIFLGEIENNKSDDIDDSALVYVMQDKLFIITGCSHSGIINIINYAKKVTGINQIYGVLGGLHLLNVSDDILRELGEYFRSENIEYLAPCHCCDLRSKIVLSHKNFIQEVCAGDIITIV